MLTKKPKTKILVDGGDPEETLRIKSLIGFVDGQTTNPSLIAKNAEIQRRIASGHKLSSQEQTKRIQAYTVIYSPATTVVVVVDLCELHFPRTVPTMGGSV